MFVSRMQRQVVLQRKRRNAIEQFRSSLVQVRRALANIPVYMTFDDHEVTDDWNMTQEFCEKVYGNKKVREPFYVIGIANEQDLHHELAHALYYMRREYRQAVNAVMHKYNTKALARRLTEMGYHRSVLADEVHAYLVSTKDLGALKASRHAALRKELKTIYRRFAPSITP